MIPGRGVLLWFTLPFLILGLWKKPFFLLSWIFLSPIPASLATGVGLSANRVAVMMPAIDILLAIGAVEFFGWLGKKKILLITYYLIIVVFFALFLEDYFIQSPYKIARDMLYGNLEAAQWVNQNIPTESNILVSKSLSEPHIYFAFASKFDPRTYQQASKNWSLESFNVSWVDQLPAYSLGRFTFKNIKDNKDKGIFIGKPDEFPQNTKTLDTLYYPDGAPSILIVKNE
jgi:hypothetical protein